MAHPAELVRDFRQTLCVPATTHTPETRLLLSKNYSILKNIPSSHYALQEKLGTDNFDTVQGYP